MLSERSTLRADSTEREADHWPGPAIFRWRAVQVALVLAAVVTTAVQLFWRFPAHCDIGNLVGTLERMLNGERLYRDIIEPAPPMFFLLAMPAVAFARLAGLPRIATYDAWQLILLLLVGALTLRVARAVRITWQPWWTTVIAWALLYVFVTFPGNSVGQKEYVAEVLTLPYVVAAAGLAEGHRLSRRLGLLLGVLVGLAISVKPYFAAIWILVEAALVLLWRRRGAWLRAETLGVVLTGAAYLAVVALFFPDYRDDLRLAAQVYGAFDLPLSEVLLDGKLWLLVPALIVAFVPLRSRLRALRQMLGCATAAFMLTALYQRKGFPYHWNASEGLAILVLTVGALDVALYAPALRPPWRRLAQVFPVVAVLAFTALSLAESVGILTGRRSPNGTVVEPLTSFLRANAKGQPVAWLATDLIPAQPSMAYADATAATRYVILWPIPSLYRDQLGRQDGFDYHSPEDTSPLERSMVDSVIDDLKTRKPAVIVIEGINHVHLPYPFLFNTYDFLMRDPRFRQVMQGYFFSRDIYGYRCYVRRPDGQVEAQTRAPG